MYIVLVLALLSTLIYVHLQIMDALNIKVNPYRTTDDKNVMLVAKVKYVLLVIMAFTWGAVIKFW